MICEWANSSVFPKPVVVTKDNVNGFLYSNNGTPNDESDDIYHHKYKLGFVGNFAPVGTNPFAFRNLFPPTLLIWNFKGFLKRNDS